MVHGFGYRRTLTCRNIPAGHQGSQVAAPQKTVSLCMTVSCINGMMHHVIYQKDLSVKSRIWVNRMLSLDETSCKSKWSCKNANDTISYPYLFCVVFIIAFIGKTEDQYVVWFCKDL